MSCFVYLGRHGGIYINKLEFLFIITVLSDDIKLKNCLDSIINQSFSNFEINCIVNQNQISSIKILKNYQKFDKRIKILFCEDDLIFIKNKCILDSSAEYLFLIDSNCWFEYVSIQKLHCILELSSPDVLLFDFRRLNGNIPLEEYCLSNSNHSFKNFNIYENKFLLLNRLPFPSFKVYRTSFLIDENIIFSEMNMLNEYLFNAKTLLLAKNIMYIPEIIINWDFERNIFTNEISYHMDNIFHSLDEIKVFLKEKNFLSEFKFEFYEFVIKILEEYLEDTRLHQKENVLNNVKTFFKKFNISSRILQKLPFNQYKFYMHILNSNSYFEFNVLHNTQIFNSNFIKNIFMNYGSVISKESDVYDEISKKLLNDVNNGNFDNIDAFIEIKKLNLFDDDFYRTEYDYDFEIDPILHYIYKGNIDGYKPNEYFDAKFYSEFNEDVKSSNIDPFIYFATKGLYDGKIKYNKDAPQPNSFINKTELSKKFIKFHECGVNKSERDDHVVVSLTSFPERIEDIHFVLYSLLNQNFKPDVVVLWLAKSQFPNLEKDLPQTVLSLKENGLTIKWCDDFRAYKKLLPSLELYPTSIIVTADDDIYYPKTWLKQLYDAHKQYPKDIISHRCRKMSLNDNNSFKKYNEWEICVGEFDSSFFNFATNGAGSLFPPKVLDERINNYELASELCPSSDDIWVWAMAVLKKTKIKVVKDNIHYLTHINPARDFGLLDKTTLWQQNVLGKNDENLNNVINEFPEIMEIILNDD